MNMASSFLSKIRLLEVLVALSNASSFWRIMFILKIIIQEMQVHQCRGEVSNQPLLKCSTIMECCKVLKKVEAGCRCQTLREMLKEVGRHQVNDERRFTERYAKVLPEFCGIKPFYCPIYQRLSEDMMGV